MRHPGPLGYLALSQIALGGLVGVCVAVSPGVVLGADEGGVSNYGVRAATVVPYTLAFALCAVGLRAAAAALPSYLPARRRLAGGMDATAAGLVAVLASTYPYKLDAALGELHLALAILLFVVQLVFITWMVFVACPRPAPIALWTAWAAGGVLGVVTLVGAAHLLFAAQADMSVGFGLATLAVTARLLDQAATGGLRRLGPH